MSLALQVFVSDNEYKKKPTQKTVASIPWQLVDTLEMGSTRTKPL